MEDTSLYWEGKGKYQKEYGRLSRRIPRTGPAKDPHVEKIRVLSNLIYEIYNNDGGNLFKRDDITDRIEMNPEWKTLLYSLLSDRYGREYSNAYFKMWDIIDQTFEEVRQTGSFLSVQDALLDLAPYLDTMIDGVLDYVIEHRPDLVGR